jgi:hypothetical protein
VIVHVDVAKEVTEHNAISALRLADERRANRAAVSFEVNQMETARLLQALEFASERHSSSGARGRAVHRT